MLDTELVSELEALGYSPTVARNLTVKIRDKLHPVSVIAARVLIKGGATPRLGSLGLTVAAGASAGGAVGGAVAGAVYGSAAGPIGTVIGLVVGAVAGMVVNVGQKPQRQAEAIAALRQLQTIPPSYAGRQISDHDMHVLFMALFLADGWLARDWLGTALTNHPSAMGNWADLIIKNFTNAMTAAKSQPVGASVTLNTIAGDKSGPYTFTNPGLDVSLGYVWAQSVMIPMIQQFARWHSASPNAVAEIAQSTNALHVLALLYDRILSTVAPENVSTQLATAPYAMVPTAIVNQGATLAQALATGGGYVALPSGPLALTPTQTVAANILATQVLPSYPQVPPVLLQKVAATGVQSTPAGPGGLPAWAIPAGIGVVGLLSR